MLALEGRGYQLEIDKEDRGYPPSDHRQKVKRERGPSLMAGGEIGKGALFSLFSLSAASGRR